ncbi:type IV pilin protein [Nitrogeniibacter mangrovi]|uniref:Type IV pilin protein n=2 Tax=Nitrogeniibacter mangrovi TaxID=2016596 RepID=A0A6C1B8M0_9RHOO|nr:type IV pilin protein [Nitrogeniibacter mangrovi]
MTAPRASRGFTLIEVMIVVAILGIIAAIAYPNYTQYVQRSRRNECEGQMTSMAAALERRYSTSGAYNSAAAPAFTCPADGGTATYNLAAALAADTFTITATPQGPQTGDKCGNLTLTQTGAKGATGGTIAECWH